MRRNLTLSAWMIPDRNVRTGVELMALGLSAYLLALVHPYGAIWIWQMKLQLICFAGFLALWGVLHLPASSRSWQVLRLMLGGVVIHWAFVLPIQFYWPYFW